MIIIEGHLIPDINGMRPLTLEDCRQHRNGVLSYLMDPETLIEILADEIERLSASRDAWKFVAPVLPDSAGFCPECGVQSPGEDGLCRACGGSCMGSAVDDMRERIEKANALETDSST
jgi:hypothetical protein